MLFLLRQHEELFPDYLAFFINPGSGGYIDKVKRTADNMIFIDHLDIGRAGCIKNGTGYGFSAALEFTLAQVSPPPPPKS